MTYATKNKKIYKKKPPGELRTLNHLHKINQQAKERLDRASAQAHKGLAHRNPADGFRWRWRHGNSGRNFHAYRRVSDGEARGARATRLYRLIEPKIDKKCLTTKLQKSRRRSHAIFAERRTRRRYAGPAGMMPAGIRTPSKHTAKQTQHGLKTAPGPSPLARLVLD